MWSLLPNARFLYIYLHKPKKANITKIGALLTAKFNGILSVKSNLIIDLSDNGAAILKSTQNSNHSYDRSQ